MQKTSDGGCRMNRSENQRAGKMSRTRLGAKPKRQASRTRWSAKPQPGFDALREGQVMNALADWPSDSNLRQMRELANKGAFTRSLRVTLSTI